MLVTFVAATKNIEKASASSGHKTKQSDKAVKASLLCFILCLLLAPLFFEVDVFQTNVC
jgi:hypothetical protein